MNKEIKELFRLLYADNLSIGGKRKLEKLITNLQKENERLKKQVSEYQDEIFARDNSWYDMQD